MLVLIEVFETKRLKLMQIKGKILPNNIEN